MNEGMVHRIFIFSTILFSLLSYTVIAGASSEERGQAFSDPSHTAEMSDDWQKKAVSYPAEFINADVVMDINQQLEPFLLPTIQDYAKTNNIQIITSKGTCGKSAARIDRKEVDIGGFCCPPGKNDRLPGLKYHTLGIVPLVIFVHPDNPVNNITLTQARQIYRGDISNWSEVGGPNLPINKIASFHCKHRPGHWTLLLESEDMFSPDILSTGEMEDMIAFVASNPGSIGYEAMMVAKRFRHRGAVKALKINGYTPTPDNLINLDYSLYRTFNITTWEGENHRNTHAQKLVDFLLLKSATFDEEMNLLPSAALKKAGWQFDHAELVAEPVK